MKSARLSALHDPPQNRWSPLVETLYKAAMTRKALEPLSIDFVAGAVGHRLRFGGGRGQDLPRACGLQKMTPFVVDATAGLGRDAFLLASLGCRVTLIERVPQIHALLREGLERAHAASADHAAIIDRMTLLCGDARELLPGLAPEVVLVDPMHPPRDKAALVKKEMRLLREIVGADQDAAALIGVALAHARNRVVVKWPRRAPLPEGLPEPSHRIVGESTRYDVFMRI